jgi:hypothetical protein
MFNKYDKQIELIKKQYSKAIKNLIVATKQADNIQTKSIEEQEIESIIDLLSSYGNKGNLAILELLDDTNIDKIRIYGYKKLTENIKKSKYR